jgi:hypothetical protein
MQIIYCDYPNRSCGVEQVTGRMSAHNGIIFAAADEHMPHPSLSEDKCGRVDVYAQKITILMAHHLNTSASVLYKAGLISGRDSINLAASYEIMPFIGTA